MPGLSVTLDEIRLHYNFEENRHSSVENKSGILIGFIGLIVTLSLLIFEYLGKNPLWFVYAFFGLSAIIAVIILFPRYFPRPHKPYGDFFSYAKLKKHELEDELLLNYIKATEEYQKKNNRSMVMIYFAYLFSIAAIVILFISLI